MASHSRQPKTISEIELPSNPNLPFVQNPTPNNSQPPSDDDEFFISRRIPQWASEAPTDGIQSYETENAYTLTVPELNKDDEVQVKVEKSCWYNPLDTLVIKVMTRKRFFSCCDGKQHRSLRSRLSPLHSGIRSTKNMRVNLGVKTS
ncbi:hypothetical protein Salat_1328600 [Sesamum alatum]|uniref:Uncharacterized protein n=1 Tax=Sesamum alatum TaxID=300844 RepID=A0AAE2CQC8_9LAMI|nr:hypothetical protein Salat_1328600 [Sesamum alatum]